MEAVVVYFTVLLYQLRGSKEHHVKPVTLFSHSPGRYTNPEPPERNMNVTYYNATFDFMVCLHQLLLGV